MTRKSLRFDPDKNCLVTIMHGIVNNEKIDKVGLVRDESYSGCCAIFRGPFPLKEGEKFKMAVGEITDLVGEIRWIKKYDNVFVTVGIFIEPIIEEIVK